MNEQLRKPGIFGRTGRRDLSPARRQRLEDTLVSLLSECFRLRQEGGALSAQLRAQEHADDYMRRLEESGVFSQRELLELIHATRSGAWGPATRTLTEEDSDARVVAA